MSGIFNRDSSIAIFCRRLMVGASEIHRMDPACPLRIASSGFGIVGDSASPPTCVSCPIFSSSVIRRSSASTFAGVCAHATVEKIQTNRKPAARNIIWVDQSYSTPAATVTQVGARNALTQTTSPCSED